MHNKQKKVTYIIQRSHKPACMFFYVPKKKLIESAVDVLLFIVAVIYRTMTSIRETEKCQMVNNNLQSPIKSVLLSESEINR